MVPGDQHDGRARQLLAQPGELVEGLDDGAIGRADRVKQIAGDDHEVGAARDHGVDGAAE